MSNSRVKSFTGPSAGISRCSPATDSRPPALCPSYNHTSNNEDCCVLGSSISDSGSVLGVRLAELPGHYRKSCSSLLFMSVLINLSLYARCIGVVFSFSFFIIYIYYSFSFDRQAGTSMGINSSFLHETCPFNIFFSSDVHSHFVIPTRLQVTAQPSDDPNSPA